MPTVTATAGSVSANSYITVAEGDTYADERLQATGWTGEDADDKARAVIQATRWLDGLDYEGTKSATSQALKWPRQAAFDEDLEEYDTASVPEVIKQATFELALVLLNDNASSEDTFAPNELSQFRRAKVGPMEVEVDRAFRAAEIPDHVRRKIAHTLRSAGMIATRERA